MFSKDSWMRAASDSALSISRTAGGVNEPAYDGAKPSLTAESVSGLTAQVRRNVSDACEFIWREGRVISLDPVCIRTFMDTVALKVSEGLLPDGFSLVRTWDTRKKFAYQTALDAIETEYTALCETVAAALGWELPLILAATLEKEIDRIHPYADGCGRSARLLGAWTLLWSGMMPVTFVDRTIYFDGIVKPLPEWIAAYRVAAGCVR